MNNTIITAIIVSLLVGGGLGYGAATYLAPATPMHPGASDAANMTASETRMMDSSMNAMVGDLKSKTGEARDIAFLEGMIAHHQGAIEMAQLVLASTKRTEIREMANGIISAQTTEIATMKEWLRTWFGR